MNRRQMIIALILCILLLIITYTPTNAKDIDYPRVYNVDMSRDNQEYLFGICLKYNVDPQLMMAIIKTESDFKPDLISKTDDYGLMQINKRNHDWLSKDLGVTDFLNPKQNMLAGVYVISGYIEKYQDYHKALMCYNFGENGAKKHFENGVVQSKYSKKVMENYDKIKFVNEVLD